MKKALSDRNHATNGTNGELMSTTDEAFVENRYRKYRFERESVVRHAPESSGVYGLYSAIWIYVGEADNIRARLLEHLAGDEPGINHYQPSGFAFELVSPPERSRRLEELIEELQPLCMRKGNLRRAAS